jgi:hypothetical protein
LKPQTLQFTQNETAVINCYICTSDLNFSRAEKLALRKRPGKMKLLGTLLCVGGAMVVSLFKGRRLHLWATQLLRCHAAATSPTGGLHHGMITGTLFLCGSCLSYALWFIVQVIC